MFPYSVPKSRFLCFISAVYFIAFTSVYIQIPGIYGEKGLLPQKWTEYKGPVNFWDFLREPNLLRLSPLLNMDAIYFLEFITIVGATLGILSTFLESLRKAPVYLTMWLIYLAIYQSGGAFFIQRWDKLLLEAGALGVLMSILSIFTSSKGGNASDKIGLWLVKWLLFRLVFSNGVKKLLTDCPGWWSLSHEDNHHQSQHIPVPTAYFMHNGPQTLHMASKFLILFAEIVLPFLFLIPLKGIRTFSFSAQFVIQIFYLATGNFGFANILTIGLCYSLLKNDDFKRGKGNRASNGPRAVTIAFAMMLFCAGTFFLSVDIAGLKGAPFSLKFSKADFTAVLRHVVTYTMYMALFIYATEVLSSLFTAVMRGGYFRRTIEVLGVLLVGSVGLVLLFSSFASFSQLDKSVSTSLPPQVTFLHKQLHPYHLTNSYGFSCMTRTKDRKEVILEGSNSPDGPWKAYEFHAKPGRVSRMPVFVAPHQPRLDWQMALLPLSKYEDSMWFNHLVFRLLSNEPDVRALLDNASAQPVSPKYIRARVHSYRFTKDAKDMNWWVRRDEKEYMPPVSLMSPTLKAAVEKSGLIGRRRQRPQDPTRFTRVLDRVRAAVGQPNDLYPILLVFFLVLLTKLAWAQPGR